MRGELFARVLKDGRESGVRRTYRGGGVRTVVWGLSESAF